MKEFFYNVVCMLFCSMPMLSFLSAAVVLAMYDHPYFAAVSMMFSIFTVPKISLGSDDKKNDEKKDGQVPDMQRIMKGD